MFIMNSICITKKPHTNTYLKNIGNVPNEIWSTPHKINNKKSLKTQFIGQDKCT